MTERLPQAEASFSVTMRAYAKEVQRRRDEEARVMLGACLTGILSPIKPSAEVKRDQPNWVAIRVHIRETVERRITEDPNVSDLEVLRYAMGQALEDYVRGEHVDPSLGPEFGLIRMLHYSVGQNPLVTEEFAASTLRAAGL